MVLNLFWKNFILEALKFILRNNNFKFDDIFCNQTEGTAMGWEPNPPPPPPAPPSPCLSLVVGYKEETELFPIELPKFFWTEEIKIIKKVFRQYMDNGLFVMVNNVELP